MSTLAATASQMLATSQNQAIGTAVARQQIAAEKAVAGLVAETAQGGAAAGPPAPPGQGQRLDLRV
ncbi:MULTISPECIES: hypothetical protein [Methylobacterium]|jgi:hypothetical protein|uniref:hypothetical protein n=1 Tax=Methylobacterium TaxID=407 RepID=UPI0011C99FA1|nr:MULTISPECIES: hypothetical protein [Methylobacterium]TXN45692.1 hypothetical protein FV233_10385 [Methylobacterium sp. WL7]GJE20170.1 hypothetical protein JHFBIEKO_0594 [Methylobacterium mesophilicum]